MIAKCPENHRKEAISTGKPREITEDGDQYENIGIRR